MSLVFQHRPIERFRYTVTANDDTRDAMPGQGDAGPPGLAVELGYPLRAGDRMQCHDHPAFETLKSVRRFDIDARTDGPSYRRNFIPVKHDHPNIFLGEDTRVLIIDKLKLPADEPVHELGHHIEELDVKLWHDPPRQSHHAKRTLCEGAVQKTVERRHAGQPARDQTLPRPCHRA